MSLRLPCAGLVSPFLRVVPQFVDRHVRSFIRGSSAIQIRQFGAVGGVHRRFCGSTSSIGKSLSTEIDSNASVIFSKINCPSSAKAKQAFADIGVEPTVFELDFGQPCDVEELQLSLLEMTGSQSIPRVFVGGKMIGSGDDTAALVADGKLQDLVEAASLKSSVLKELAANAAVVFSEGGPYPFTCQARRVFADIGVEPIVFRMDLAKPHISDELDRLLCDMTGGQSMPKVFVGGEFVGSGNETAALAAVGKLQALEEIASLRLSILHEIQANTVVIFSHTYCPFSSKAKQAFTDIDVEPTIFELDLGKPHVASDVQQVLQEITSVQFIPQVFVGGKCVSTSDMDKLVASEGLQALVDMASLRSQSVSHSSVLEDASHAHRLHDRLLTQYDYI